MTFSEYTFGKFWFFYYDWSEIKPTLFWWEQFIIFMEQLLNIPIVGFSAFPFFWNDDPGGLGLWYIIDFSFWLADE